MTASSSASWSCRAPGSSASIVPARSARLRRTQLERLAEGVTIEGMRYGPIIANLERRTGRNCWIEMSLTEGKNREVRNVLGFLGLQVSRLIRTAYGPLDVSGLEPGDVDEVSQAELDALRASLK